MKKTILLMAALSLVALQACKEEKDTPVLNVVDSGTCGAQGSNLTWTLKNDGTLTIAGNGAMENYDDETEPSWTDYLEYISTVVIQDGVTGIGESAFSGCTSLTSITIPGSVMNIGEYAFYGCSFTSVSIPENVTNIEAGVFIFCSDLTSVTIPEGVTSIGREAFYYCTSLASITIPGSVMNIGKSAFSSCSSLTSVTISEGVESIEGGAFYNCTGLTRIAVKAPIPPAIDTNELWGSFGGVDTFVPVYVPASSIEAYRNGEWGQYFNNIQPISY